MLISCEITVEKYNFVYYLKINIASISMIINDKILSLNIEKLISNINKILIIL